MKLTQKCIFALFTFGLASTALGANVPPTFNGPISISISTVRSVTQDNAGALDIVGLLKQSVTLNGVQYNSGGQQIKLRIDKTIVQSECTGLAVSRMHYTDLLSQLKPTATPPGSFVVFGGSMSVAGTAVYANGVLSVSLNSAPAGTAKLLCGDYLY